MRASIAPVPNQLAKLPPGDVRRLEQRLAHVRQRRARGIDRKPVQPISLIVRTTNSAGHE